MEMYTDVQIWCTGSTPTACICTRVTHIPMHNIQLHMECATINLQITVMYILNFSKKSSWHYLKELHLNPIQVNYASEKLTLNPVSVSCATQIHTLSRVQDTTCLLRKKQNMTMASPKKPIFFKFLNE